MAIRKYDSDDSISEVDPKEDMEFPTADSFDKLDSELGPRKERSMKPQNESDLEETPELIEAEECLEWEESGICDKHPTTLCSPHGLKPTLADKDLLGQDQNASQIAFLHARMSNMFSRMRDLEKQICQMGAADVWNALATLKSDFEIDRQISSDRQLCFQKHVAETFKAQETKLETARKNSDDKIWTEFQVIREGIKALSTAVRQEKHSYCTISEICDKLRHAVKAIQEDGRTQNQYVIYQVELLSDAVHSLDRNMSDLRKKTQSVDDWPEKVNLLTCTSNAALDSVADLNAKFKEFEKNVWTPKLETINGTLQTSMNEAMQIDHRLVVVEENLQKVMLRDSSARSNEQEQVTEEDKIHDGNVLERLKILESSVFGVRDRSGQDRVKTFPSQLHELADHVATHSSLLHQLHGYQLETVRHCKPLIEKTETLAQQTADLETLTRLEFRELQRDQSDVHRRMQELKRQFENSLITLKQTVQDTVQEEIVDLRQEMIDLTDGTSMYFQEELSKARDACDTVLASHKDLIKEMKKCFD